MEKRIYTTEELADCIQAALDNWDFDACTDFPSGDLRRQALAMALENPARLCDDGIFEIGNGYTDIWDALSEYAQAEGANLASIK